MEQFTCPQCGRQSTFDPWIESARCATCGFHPPTGVPPDQYVRWARRYAYQRFLEELEHHWHGSHTPDPSFELEGRLDAGDFFREYRQALGESPRGGPGLDVSYVRNYQPNETEGLIFAGAYAHLRRGDRETAASDLKALNLTSPEFVDPWVWLTATTGDPGERRRYLETATRLDAGHPLARDALAIIETGRWPTRPIGHDKIITGQCPNCGGAWEYRPSEGALSCPYCGEDLPLEHSDLVDGPAGALHALRLKRRVQGHTWNDVARTVRCQTCGAEISLVQHLAQVCAFCGSSNVLAADSRHELEQPDGFLPFGIDEASARVALEGALGGGVRRFVSWLRDRTGAICSLHGIYIPFWVFDGIVESYRFMRGLVRSEKQSLGWHTYENLLFPGFDVPPRNLVQKISPFDIGSLVPYEPGLLANWPAELYSRDVELVAEEAYGVLMARARTAAPQPSEATSGRYGRIEFGVDSSLARYAASPPPDLSIAFQVVGATYQLVLLPVWVARVADDEGVCLALVNGQTGRVAIGRRQPVAEES